VIKILISLLNFAKIGNFQSQILYAWKIIFPAMTPLVIIIIIIIIIMEGYNVT